MGSPYHALSDPPYDFQAVTLTDDTTLADLAPDGNGECRGLYIGTAGNVAVATVGDPTTKKTLTNVPVGILPGRFVTVYSTAHGTTASGIFAIY